MSRLKSSLLLSTSIVMAASQAGAIELRYETYSKPSPAFELNFGTIMLGAVALGAAAAMIGGKSDGDKSSDNDGETEDPIDDEPDAPGGPADFFETTEYKRNWGLTSLKASSRYADGGTGAGAVGAIFDSGADVTHSEFSDRIDYTYSYFNGTSDVTDTNGHGTSVLGVAGAAKNDAGMHGVAYDSSFLIFQAVGAPTIMDSVATWADATRKSVDLGANAINHSWTYINENEDTITIADYSGREDLVLSYGTDIFDALDYAVENDLVSVFAAGNSGMSEVAVTGGLPVYFPEYSDHNLVVVSIDETDQISNFSNRCGIAADFCLAAPGEGIYTTDTGGGYTNISGTSFAAPHAQGAVLVLASNFPELTGAEITRILKDTARDIGAPGVDAIYGHGALDLENAVAPQGMLSLQTSESLNERSFDVTRSHISTSGGMTKALASSFATHGVMVTDKYDRGYTAEMDAFVGVGADAARDRLKLQAFTTGRASDITIAADQAHLSFAPSSLSAVASSVPGTVSLDPYAALIENPGSVALKADLEGAQIQLSHAFSQEGAVSDGRYFSAEIRKDIGAHGLTLGAGTLSEAGAFVGTDVTGAFGAGLEADTHFVTVKGDFDIGSQRSITLGGSIGSTSFAGNGILQSGKDIGTSSLGVQYAHSGLIYGSDRLTLSASRNLNVTGGKMQARTPTSLGVATQGVRSDEVKMTQASIDMASTAAPIDLGLGYEVELTNGRLAFGAAFRGGDYGHAVGSVGYSLRF